MLSFVDKEPKKKKKSLLYLIIVFRLENITCNAVYSHNEAGNKYF